MNIKTKIIEEIQIESKDREKVKNKMIELEKQGYVFDAIDTNDWENREDKFYFVTGYKTTKRIV